jgi:hypothetical protein
MVRIYDYVGQRFAQGEGCGSSEIDLANAPIPTGEPPGVILCTFVLAFANDTGIGDGTFQPQWDTDHYSAQNLAGVTAAIPTVNFALSLGGAAADWNPISSEGNFQEAWISNAVSSITGIMQTYGLVGVDVDYEQGPDGSGLDDSFVQCMSQVILSMPNASWSLAPFTQTLDSYLDLYDAVADSVRPAINFQAYSMETADPQAYINQYANINSDSRVMSHGAANIGLGIDSNTADPPPDGQLGMQFPDITNFCFSHITGGTGTPNGLFNQAMIWSAEDSCTNGYPIERALSGPPP